MNYKQLEIYIFDQLKNKTKEYKRLFHGRGGSFESYEDLTIDSIDKVIYAALYKEVDYEDKLIKLLEKLYFTNQFEAVVLQKRYEFKSPILVLYGTLPETIYAYENELKYILNLQDNQNIGFFPDMKNGRQYVQKHAEDKNVLNLFSYTCSFCVAAMHGNAKQVINVDMSKNALNTGKINHRINKMYTKMVKFLPYNILKSWSRIKKFAPYDLIIIDPPSFQKGSFVAHKDYIKLVRRLDQLASDRCTILSCLNAVDLDSQFLIDLMKENQPSFKFKKQLENPVEFPTIHPQKALKNLVFSNYE